jgi:uncharacterized protein (DUF885 family)
MTTSSVTELADDYWDFHRGSAQFWNIDRGDVDEIERWEDLSNAGVAARVERLGEFVRRAEAQAALAENDGDRTLVAAVGFSAQSTIATLPYMRDLTLVGGSMNLAAFMKFLVPAYALASAQHGRGYVTKLRQVPAFVDGWIDGLRAGIAAGRCATGRGVTKAIAELDAMLVVAPADDPLVGQDAPTELSADQVANWRVEVADAVRRDVRPAMARLREALNEVLLPAARSDERAGICHVPGGEADYQALLRAATSTELTAAEVFELGHQTLASLDDEYRVLGAAALGVSDPAEVRARLRDDPLFRYTTAAELTEDATAALTRASREAPQWFTRLPNASCVIAPIQGGGMAFYTGPSPDGERGGTCYFNVSDPAIWTRSSLEATMFHESVPGHHLQLALAQELDLHPVVGELEVASFGEGWGLYAERLADEMSLYTGPLQRLGMLTLDSLRAARLVVDTGLHAMGWTREQAIDFMLGTTSLVRSNVEGEVDRYIADPGQATSYMIGRLEIDRLRRTAYERLGDRFSVAAFHDTVLGNGMMPLPALDRLVSAWIEGQAGQLIASEP